MTITRTPPLRPQVVASEALIEEARRRQRRRRLVIALVVLVAAVVTAAVVTGSRGGGPARHAAVRPRPTRTPQLVTATPLDDSLLVVPGGENGVTTGVASRMSVINAGSGAAASISPFSPAAAATDSYYPWLVIGRDVVAIVGISLSPTAVDVGTAEVFSPATKSLPVNLGAATGVLAAVRPDAVWLLTDNARMSDFGGSASPPSGRCTVREVSLAGVTLTPTMPYSCARVLFGAVDGGLLSSPVATSGNAPIEVWDPATGRVVRTITTSGTLISTSASLNSSTEYVAWQTGSQQAGSQGCRAGCPTFVTDVVTGRRIRVTLPPAPGGIVLGSAFSPVAPLLAEVVMTSATEDRLTKAQSLWAAASPPCCFSPIGTGAATLDIVDLATGSVLSARPISAGLPESIQWSADGSYVFVTRSLTQVGVYPAWSAKAAAHAVALPETPFSDADYALSFLVVTR
jgi:hypothetical protein